MKGKFDHYNLELEEVLIGTPGSSKADTNIETIAKYNEFGIERVLSNYTEIKETKDLSVIFDKLSAPLEKLVWD